MGVDGEMALQITPPAAKGIKKIFFKFRNNFFKQLFSSSYYLFI
jgi:hypothetical protein